MNDTQVLTLALSIVIPITVALAALIHSNNRISEAKETLRAEMALGFERMTSRFDKVDAALKIHELEHHSR